MPFVNLEILNVILFFAFLIKRLLVLSHFYQQEEYDNTRFLKLIWCNIRFIDKRFSFVYLFLFGLNMAGVPYFKWLFALALVGLIYLESNPLKQAKKPLVLTKRLKSILFVALVLNLLLLVVGFAYLAVVSVILVHGLSLTLVLANIILMPYEKQNQAKYYQDAQRILAEYKPEIIAITGSYGKTSAKYILHQILASATNALATPGSVNTVMGIVRIIREQLKPEHKFLLLRWELTVSVQ